MKRKLLDRMKQRQCKTCVQLLDVKWYSSSFAQVMIGPEMLSMRLVQHFENFIGALTNLTEQQDELKSQQTDSSNRIINLKLTQDSNNYQTPNQNFQQRGNYRFNNPRGFRGRGNFKNNRRYNNGNSYRNNYNNN